MDTGAPDYTHTQKAPLFLILYGTAVILLIGAWLTQEEKTTFLALGIGGIVTAVVAPAFHHLTVVDQGDGLNIRFGPIPMFRRTVRYADIEKVEIGRTLILDGWGIHFSIRGGWVWNLWDRDCVVVRMRNSVLRIGTDDAENLARFLKGKIGHTN